MFRNATWFALVSARCESAMNATPSAPWSTSRRVALWMTCPGTVNSLMRTWMPLAVLTERGKRSKKRVRSSRVSSVINRPDASGVTSRWIACRFVVFPLSAGP